MQIYIRTLTGKTFTVEIEGSDTLFDLRCKLEAKEGTPPYQQRLVFGGAELVDDDSLFLDQINAIQTRLCPNEPISESSHITLHLIVRLRGGTNEIHHEPNWIDSYLDDALPQNGKENKHLVGKLSGEGTQIHIKTLTGHEIPVEIVCSDTLDDIKQKIFNKEGINPDDQRLIFGECQLSDGVVLDQLADAVLGTEPGPGGPWYYFDDTTGTAHVTLLMMKLRLKGGNAKSHGVQTQSSSFDCDNENRRDDKPIRCCFISFTNK